MTEGYGFTCPGRRHDLGAFIRSSAVMSETGLMARLVVKDSITSRGALAPGQTLRLGGFTMTAHSADKPMMTSRVIENRLHVDSEHSKRMDPTELSSLNKLLDHIAAMGATDYDQIGLKPDQREIKSPPITHQIAIVEERDDNSSGHPPARRCILLSEHRIGRRA